MIVSICEFSLICKSVVFFESCAMALVFLFHSGKVRWSTGSPSFLFDVQAIAHSLGSPLLPSCLPALLLSSAAYAVVIGSIHIYFIEAQFSGLPTPRRHG